jgi:hypothetical protein
MRRNFGPSSWNWKTFYGRRVYYERIIQSIKPYTSPSSVRIFIGIPIPMDDFLRAHTRHLPQCQLYQATCPFCEIIVREQTDAYVGILESLFEPVVARFWKRWDAEGTCIANNTTSETLTSELAFSALCRWVQPKYRETQGLTPDELRFHPYVQKKGAM